MMPTCTTIHAAVLAAALAGLWSSRAHAQARRAGLYAARFVEHAGADTVDVAWGSTTLRARVRGALARPDVQWLYAVDNANGAYRYACSYRGRFGPEQVVLLNDGVPAAASARGRDTGRRFYDFALDRAQADATALQMGVPRQDRVPCGERVTGTFATTAPRYARGAAMEVTIALHNPAGAPAVQRLVGCGRFSFVVYRDGRRVTELTPGALACPVTFVELASGATGDDRVDVGAWGHFVTPGHYRLECRYETQFACDGVATVRAPDFYARVWDGHLAGVVEFDVD